MKVFLDTNVLASGFATRGLCVDVIREIMGEHELVVSEYVIVELTKTLRYKFHVPEPSITNIVALLHRFQVVPTPGELNGFSVRDEKDIPVLAAATTCGADVLVTGDRDLLILRNHKSLQILSPRTFWEVLQKR